MKRLKRNTKGGEHLKFLSIFPLQGFCKFFIFSSLLSSLSTADPAPGQEREEDEISLTRCPPLALPKELIGCSLSGCSLSVACFCASTGDRKLRNRPSASSSRSSLGVPSPSLAPARQQEREIEQSVLRLSLSLFDSPARATPRPPVAYSCCPSLALRVNERERERDLRRRSCASISPSTPPRRATPRPPVACSCASTRNKVKAAQINQSGEAGQSAGQPAFLIFPLTLYSLYLPSRVLSSVFALYG
ncbi:hypothetical protein AXF42_Ash015530 [Apostasia shenzhenica]|uniref:Uncharacterized protein n=1 Tax=Apostasia shenzhenica TaxID=1088818 RepID=A0A2I0AKK5_9ASPA|nr:hypothetical protein AXF42_Ash015530 [Apostasia shenzhenica]